MKHFMLDIETTGTDPKVNHVLEIALLELSFGDDGLYHPGRAYQRTLHYGNTPTDEWVKENLGDLLKRCRKVPPIRPSQVRAEILQFFRECGEEGPVGLMGVNLNSLDLPFLLEHEYLKKSDYHYRVYELKGSFNTAQDVLRLDAKEMFRRARAACPEIQPQGQRHEALFDCYNQLRSLNGLIRILRGES